jgi:DNA-binding transcriptional MocR family regulator
VVDSRITALQLADLLGPWTAAGGPLFRRLATRIEALVESGLIPPGTVLPAERKLALAIAVGRNTATAAYELLRERGLADTRRGSGTRVAPSRASPAGSHKANGFFASLLDTLPIEFDLTLAVPPIAPAVARALTDPTAFLDRGELAHLASGSGYYAAGHPLLRDAVAEHLTRRSRLPTLPEQILVTTGAQQAIDLVVRGLTSPGQPAIVEEVTFPGVLDAMSRAAARPVICALTPDGVDLASLQRAVHVHGPALVYLITTHQNPTGSVVPDRERIALGELAERNRHIVFVDDTVLAELDHGRCAPAPLATYAPRAGNILTIGSLSKIYWGGLRVGWIRATGGLVQRLAAIKTASDLGSPAPPQVIAAALLAREHESIRRWRKAQLRQGLHALTAALARELPEWRWQCPHGGLTLWAELPRGDARSFAHRALRHGVATVPGPLLSASDCSPRHLRIPYVLPPAALKAAVRRLASAWR